MPRSHAPVTDPRRKRIRLAHPLCRGAVRPFLLTICTAGRFPWFFAHQGLAEDATAAIAAQGASRGTILYAWCVMPDHIHVLCQDADIQDFVRAFKGGLTIAARRLDPSRRLWQRSFHDHALREHEQVLTAARYVLENPARAGIVARARDYRWSGSAVWPGWRSWP